MFPSFHQFYFQLTLGQAISQAITKAFQIDTHSSPFQTVPSPTQTLPFSILRARLNHVQIESCLVDVVPLQDLLLTSHINLDK